jgi:antirestriction protein ArdC
MKDLYQAVTNQVIAVLEAGTPPWVCPWTHSGGSMLPANAASSRPYRGINVLLLQMQAAVRGYERNRWLTFNQARALGAHVRRGEEGTGIVFFKMHEVDGAERMPAASNDGPGRRVIPLLRSFTVFNVAQVDDLPEALAALPLPAAEWAPVAEADAVLQRSGATIRHGGDMAFYRPSDDVIQLPPRTQFPDASHYYNVALHELTHWTGHATRCNRPLVGRSNLTAYAFEELVAEMGAAFMSSHCGLPGELQHASYISHWLEALRSDKRLVFTAASLAQKAADYLTGDAGALPGAGQFAAQVADAEAA